MTSRLAPHESLQRITDGYASTAAHNDAIFELFTERTNNTPLLREHRDWIEENKWGFGDRAFHYMWLLLMQDIADNEASFVRLLEIGVYKGQTLSLWTLLARELGISAEIFGITPMLGKPPMPRVFHRARMLVDAGYRQDAHVGNLHTASNYESDIEKVFDRFSLPFDKVRIVRGLSQDESVYASVREFDFDIVYVDGGHRYEEVARDLELYAPLVRPGGYLVVDDAGFFEPGTVFFKGFESVSRAAQNLDNRIFRNVLNVGHNRIFHRAARTRE